MNDSNVQMPALHQPSPQPARSIWDAIRLLSTIDDNIKKSCEWLRDGVKRTGGRVGWTLGEGYQWDGIALWGGTIDAIRALFAVNEYFPEIKDASQDLLNSRASGGGWDYHYSTGSSWVVPTSWAVISLAEINKEVPDESIDYLLQTRNQETGAWGIGFQATPRIYPTLLAVWALTSIGRREEADRGLKWLLDRQQQCGGWSLNRTDQEAFAVPSVALTSQIVYVLENLCSDATIRATKANALRWLASNVNTAALEQEVEYYRIEMPQLTENPHFRHFSTAWAILAFAASGLSPIEVPAFLTAAEKLVATQSHGVWRIPEQDNFVRTYFVAHGLLALLAVRRSLQRTIWTDIASDISRKIDEIDIANTSINEKLGKIEERSEATSKLICQMQVSIDDVTDTHLRWSCRLAFVIATVAVEYAAIRYSARVAKKIIDHFPNWNLSNERAGYAQWLIVVIVIMVAQVIIRRITIVIGKYSTYLNRWRPFDMWIKWNKNFQNKLVGLAEGITFAVAGAIIWFICGH